MSESESDTKMGDLALRARFCLCFDELDNEVDDELDDEESLLVSS